MRNHVTFYKKRQKYSFFSSEKSICYDTQKSIQDNAKGLFINLLI